MRDPAPNAELSPHSRKLKPGSQDNNTNPSEHLSNMNTTTLAFIGGGIGGPEIFLILAVVLILFGAKKVPELARGMGQGIKEFKKASREVQDDISRSIDEDERKNRDEY